MRWVRNKLTGLVHSVPDDHWALRHPDFEEVQPDQAGEEPREEEPQKAEPRRRRK